MGKVLGCLGLLVFVIAMEFLVAWVAQFLWNALVPSVFHGPVLTYWQAFIGVCLLSFIGNFFRSSSKS